MRTIRFIITAALLFIPLSSYTQLQTTSPLQDKIIIVDAGHGTINFDRAIINAGKRTNDGVPEHLLTLDIAEKVKTTLEELGAKVFMTRTSEDYWRPAYNSVDDNKARAIYANQLKGDILLSIHCDWHPNRKVHGVTTLYAKSHSRRLAHHIHRTMVKKLKAKDRKTVFEDFTILDHANMPAVIIETGFMSHNLEMRKIKRTDYQKKIASAISTGVVRYFKK